MTMLTEVTRNGVTVQVNIGTARDFTCQIADVHFSADRLADLIKKIDTATKKIAKDVSVPMTVVDFQRGEVVVKQATATGLHSGTAHPLIRWDKSGRKEQLTHWNVPGEIFRPLSADDVSEYVRLVDAVKVAQEARDMWMKSRKLNVKQAVIDALKAGADTTTETEV